MNDSAIIHDRWAGLPCSVSVTRRRDYDLDLEVLASVPYAVGASLQTLAADFRMTAMEMKQKIAGLAAGFSVSVHKKRINGVEYQYVRVPQQARESIEAVLLPYWAKVWEA